MTIQFYNMIGNNARFNLILRNLFILKKHEMFIK